MLLELVAIYVRDLDRLKEEIKTFNQEENLWQVTGQVKNSAGNLSLHLVGNLKTYIGKNLGSYAYVRDREAEFHLKNVPREQLIQQVEETKAIVLASLQKLDSSRLADIYPEETLGYTMTTGFFLIHLAAHLSYHLGQINYLRRILEN